MNEETEAQRIKRLIRESYQRTEWLEQTLAKYDDIDPDTEREAE